MFLGDLSFSTKSFSNLPEVLSSFETKEFQKLGDRQRSDKVNRALLELIQKEKEPAFLLREVLDFVEKVDTKNYLFHYTFNSFELWLNHSSNLSVDEMLRIRGKIVGKWIPREEYQRIFPIGMNKTYEGSHFVTAHKSPDLDTTVASFWGWVDAFGARVGSNLHFWNVPGGPPLSQIEIEMIFIQFFGKGVFSHLAKKNTFLSVTGNDLMSQKKMLQKTLEEKMVSVSLERDSSAVVLVDKEGYFLGDWRNMDVQGVRQLIMLLNGSLRWFENHVHVKFISLFAKPKLHSSEVPLLLKNLFQTPIKEAEPVKEYVEKDREKLHQFLQKVFLVEGGITASFEKFAKALHSFSIFDLEKVQNLFDSTEKLPFFDRSGFLIEDRPLIFSYLEKAVQNIHTCIQNVRGFLEKFDIALKVKTLVYGHSPNFVTVRDDVEEIKLKMDTYQHLTVVYPDKNRFFPVGTIFAEDLRKKTLGTVSLRDFCNREEMGIPSYLEVISVIDHHKSALQTLSPPTAIIADAQSSNAIVFELTHKINQKYSTQNQSLEKVEKQIEELSKKTDPSSIRKLRNLLQKKGIFQKKQEYYVHVEREMMEYLHFLYGILDDTDLLSKVSYRDVEAVCSILNNLKSLATQEEVEIVSLEELPKDETYLSKAAKLLLQNEDLYSLYKKVYAFREKEVEKNIQLCVKKEVSSFFADTKEQNGCCRVGQTKLFSKNISSFEKNQRALQKVWLEKALDIQEDSPEFDLHLHMLSTIVGAEEVYQGEIREYAHKDQLWIWIPETEMGASHLKRFLSSFQDCEALVKDSLEVLFLGENTSHLEQIFQESFFPIPHKKGKGEIAMAILYYKAGSINSRKAMISPFLPYLHS